jgi:hypothetical protein
MLVKYTRVVRTAVSVFFREAFSIGHKVIQGFILFADGQLGLGYANGPNQTKFCLVEAMMGFPSALICTGIFAPGSYA